MISPGSSSHPLPAYAQAEREIRKMLSSMKEGERILPERVLCTQFGISRVTLRRAMESFHKSGVLSAQQGGGTWLVRRPDPIIETRDTVGVIGLLVPTVENPMIARIVRGAEQCTADLGCHLALAHDHGDQDYQIEQLRRMLDRGLSGVAVYADRGNIKREAFLTLLKEVQDRRVPLVMIDRYVPHLDAPSVLSDNYAGMYEATQHLILSGYRRFALLAFGSEGGITDRDRRKGFYGALQDYGIDAKCMEADLGTRDHEIYAEEAVNAWLVKSEGRPAFDAIVCMQDNMAFGAYLALRKHGISVPDQVGLTGYDNLDRELYRTNGLSLTSLDQPAEAIGYQAAGLLLKTISGEVDPAKPKHILLKPSLIIRASSVITETEYLDEAATPVA